MREIYYHIYMNKQKRGAQVGEPKNKTPYGANGRMVFDRLWKALEIRGKNKQWLKDNGIHSNTVAKLTKNENVTCEVLANICNLLDCQPWDIMEYRK